MKRRCASTDRRRRLRARSSSRASTKAQLACTSRRSAGTSGVRADRHCGPGKRPLNHDEARPRARASGTATARALAPTEIGRAAAELLDEASSAPSPAMHAIEGRSTRASPPRMSRPNNAAQPRASSPVGLQRLVRSPPGSLRAAASPPLVERLGTDVALEIWSGGAVHQRRRGWTRSGQRRAARSRASRAAVLARVRRRASEGTSAVFVALAAQRSSERDLAPFSAPTTHRSPHRFPDATRS
jgi:hypothetical protein